MLDKRIKTWNFFWWEDGKRHSKKIGTVREFPTKAAAWKAAKPLRDALENRGKLDSNAPTVRGLVAQYRAEKMAQRASTRRGYQAWLDNHVLPRWDDCSIEDVQPREVELWLNSLALSPKSRVHIRGVLHQLWEFAVWGGVVPTQRKPYGTGHHQGCNQENKEAPQSYGRTIPFAASSTRL